LPGPLVYVLVPPLKFGPDCVVHVPEYWILESSFCTVVFVKVALRSAHHTARIRIPTHPSAPSTTSTTAMSSKSPSP
jgi:hypothetical protein